MPTAISDARWQEAQRYEAEYWQKESENPAKLQRDISDGHHFTAGVLDIRAATVGGRAVLDIAGGPYPLIGEPGLQIKHGTVIDPARYPRESSWCVDNRVHMCAEDYVGAAVDEVWGYNVLQHVRSPAEVMAMVRRHARVVRWFDVVDTPIYPVHPHSISAEWLRQQMSMDGFKIIRDIDGSRLIESHRQKFVALVAERVV